MKRILLTVFALLVAAPLYAQNANLAQLRLVIVDQTGAGIPAAMISVTPQGAQQPITAMSDERGLATVPDLPLGTAQLHVEFPGFLPTDAQLTLKRGANNQNVELKIEGFQEQVVVEDTTATDDRRGNSMSTTLEQSEIDALPDDPDELADYLTQLAGGNGAIFQVNGFRGGRLPSRDEIQQIRLRTNSFAADNHDAGRTQIEIITKPNVRDWSGNANLQYRNDALNAKNAFADTKTPEQNRQFNFGLRGPLVKNRTSIRFNVDGRRDVQSDVIFAYLADGTQLRQGVTKPSDSTNVTVGIEHGLTSNQTLRFEVRRGENSNENNGVGGFNLPERGTSRTGENYSVRGQLQGVIGKTSLNEFRIEVTGNRSETDSLSNDQAIVVNQAFSSGGSGANNTNSNRQYEIADNFDFNVGRKQQMRVGVLMEGGRYKYFDQSNANGTFTFQSLAAYQGILNGTPLVNPETGEEIWPIYRVRTGLVNTNFNVWQLGFYWQDDIRVNSKFSYSVGVRNEMQSLLDDKLNLMPRLGFTWTPKGNKTAIRGGYGIFYDWYDSGLYDQTLRVNGRDQFDELVVGAGYPDPYSRGDASSQQPGGRIQAAPDLKMPMTHQASIGIERQVTQNLTVQFSYQMLRSRDQMRSINLNQPFISGYVPNPFSGDLTPVFDRPDDTVGNITQFESTGRANSDRYTINYNYRIPGRNLFFGGNYTIGFAKNDNDGATSLPMDSNNLAAEWGTARNDIRHRFQSQFNLPVGYGIRFNSNVNWQSGSPYTITTGFDENKDGLLNDRPAGVGRNTKRGDSTWTVNMRVQKVFGIGAPQGGGAGFPGGGGGPRVGQQRGQGGGGGRGGGGGFNNTNSRYNVELYISADNVFNHVNYNSYISSLNSNRFGEPTSAGAPRRVQVGMGFRF
jgi:hypothetical protein